MSDNNEKIETPKDDKTGKGETKDTNERTIHVKHTFETVEKQEKPETPETNPDAKDGKPKENPEKPEKKDDKATEKIPEKEPTSEPNDKKIKGLEDKLEEREAQLATIALKAFEEDKKDLLSKITDEAKRKKVEEFIGEEPERLEQVQAWTNIFVQALEKTGTKVEDATKIDEKTGKPIKPAKPADDKDKTGDSKPKDTGAKDENPEDVEKVPPKGIVGLPKATGTNVTSKKILDELFAILRDPKAKQDAKAEADRRIAIFYKNLYAGRREGILAGRKDYGFAMIVCRKCNKVIMGRRDEDIKKCPYCGDKFTEKR